NTYFAVFHSRNPRPPFEVMGQELLPTARPTAQAEFEVTGTGAQRGTYYPSLAASTRAPQWTAVAALEFTSIVGQRIQSVTDGGGSGPIDPPPTDDEVKPDPTSFDFATASNGTEFFAEGVASADSFAFNTYYQIQNDNDIAASVRAYFARQTSDGSIVLKERLYQVPANGRRTIDLKASVGLGPWSAIFQSMTPGAPVTTQQSLLWGPNLEGSSSETGVRAASSQWLFAEGTRGGNDYFSNFFLLFNPNPQPITVVGEYFGNGSSQPSYLGYTVPPYSRYTVFANGELPGMANQDFSTRFFTEDGSLFVAQRAMYWGQGFVGGHTAVGANAANATWMFAEGAAAPDFDTYFTLLNPNGFEVTVNGVFLTEAFGPIALQAPLTVKPYSRQTVWANGVLGNVGAFGTTFTTVGGHGIVVERSVYWGGAAPNWVEGTNDLGANAPATTWSLPEGSDEGPFDTFVLVANPNTYPVNVRVQFYLETGGRITVPDVQINGETRLTIDMNAPRVALPGLSAEDAALLKGKAFSTRVTSTTPNGPVIVEGAVYRNWDPVTRWRAGASAFGVPQ
ncbi:MAG: hypothetical protein MUF60_06745, partial [Vicinamibacterales bacterium]|nr:hypothetical protein [Vicinamibacterales bacterium]